MRITVLFLGGHTMTFRTGLPSAGGEKEKKKILDENIGCCISRFTDDIGDRIVSLSYTKTYKGEI